MIEVIQCGQLNSIQDLGRYGLRAIGIGTSGAMDSLALRVGNILVGNAESLAAIEVQTFPFALRFERAARFAITGADAPALLDEIPLPPWWSMAARAGQVLRIAQPRAGARVYVSLSGGIDVPPSMGSRSTNMRNGFGGLEGRALQKGDRLATPADIAMVDDEVGANVPAGLLAQEQPLAIRVVAGAEYDILPAAQQHAFWHSDWTVTPQSDRGGYRLRGAELRLPTPMEMRSYGVVAGIIQLPPSGQPIIQLSDANTAGGYPRLGGVIEADLHRLGQARPGTTIRFIETGFEQARSAQQEIDDFLAELRSAMAARSHAKPEEPSA